MKRKQPHDDDDSSKASEEEQVSVPKIHDCAKALPKRLVLRVPVQAAADKGSAMGQSPAMACDDTTTATTATVSSIASWSYSPSLNSEDTTASTAKLTLLKLLEQDASNNNRILTTIYNHHLPHPRDQTALSLTCRRIAVAVASDPSLVLKPGLVRVNCRSYVYGHEHLLNDLKKWGWIPEGLQLCSVCWKYLPRERVWMAPPLQAVGIGGGNMEKSELKSVKGIDWMWAVMMWTREVKVDGLRRCCPVCAVPREFWELEREGMKTGLGKGDGERGDGEGENEEGVFCQAWGEGMVERVMVVQRYKKLKREGR